MLVTRKNGIRERGFRSRKIPEAGAPRGVAQRAVGERGLSSRKTPEAGASRRVAQEPSASAYFLAERP
jgi:hypothetical protein